MAGGASGKGRKGSGPSARGGTNKKRAKPSSGPFSARERAEATQLLESAAELLASYRDEVASPSDDPVERVALRTDLDFLAEFVEAANGGRLFDRNRRWALLYELTKDARARRARPTPDEIARWRLLPRAYASGSKDAVRARGLLAKAVAAPDRYEWLARVVEAIAAVEPGEVGSRGFSPHSFERTVLAHRSEERRVLR